MGSIVGEKPKGTWHNASASDIAEIDALISAKSTELNNATSLYSQAMNGIALCDNRSLGCVKKSGRHISTWRDQRDTYGPIVERLKKELYDLQDRRTALVKSINESAAASQMVAETSKASAEAAKALADAETVQATATASKFGIYAIIGAVVLIFVVGGVFVYKMYKKK